MNKKELMKLIESKATDCFTNGNRLFISIDKQRLIINCSSNEEASELQDTFLLAMRKKFSSDSDITRTRKNFTNYETEMVIKYHKKPRFLADLLDRSYNSIIRRIFILRTEGFIRGVGQNDNNA
ncbi:MAG: hypothetical protein ACRC6U_09125 [Fusobacteriaceae bacterium]